MYEVNHGATKSHRHRIHRPARLLTSWWAALCRGRPAACVQAARRSAPRCRQWSVCSQQEGVAERASASSSSALAGACRCACTRRRAVPHTAARLSPHSRTHSPRVWSCYCGVREAGRSAPGCEMPRRASQSTHLALFAWLRGRMPPLRGLSHSSDALHCRCVHVCHWGPERDCVHRRAFAALRPPSFQLPGAGRTYRPPSPSPSPSPADVSRARCPNVCPVAVWEPRGSERDRGRRHAAMSAAATTPVHGACVSLCARGRRDPAGVLRWDVARYQ